MKPDLKKLVLIGGMALSFIVSTSGAGLAADTIKLGVPGAHSGDLASYGLPSVKAAELVVKKLTPKEGFWVKRSNF